MDHPLYGKNNITLEGCFIAQMKRFDALITTQKKNLSSLQSPFSEKIKKNLKKINIFSEMGLCREPGFFALQSLHQNASFKLSNNPLG